MWRLVVTLQPLILFQIRGAVLVFASGARETAPSHGMLNALDQWCIISIRLGCTGYGVVVDCSHAHGVLP